MRKSALAVCAALAAVAAVAGPAGAHVGAVVAVARFTTPADPTIMHFDPSDTIAPMPFVWTTAAPATR